MCLFYRVLHILQSIRFFLWSWNKCVLFKVSYHNCIKLWSLMPCLCLKGLHPASQEHGCALNVDPQVPRTGVCSGFWLNTHMASGRNCIPTYAFSPGEPHSSARLLQPRYLLCSSTPHHHCPPRSGWSGAARSSGCCTVCRTACRAQHGLSGTTRDGERELHLHMQAADDTTNGNKLYLWFSTCKQKGRCWKCWVQP